MLLVFPSAQGEKGVVVNRLKKQLDQAIRDEKKILEEFLRKKRAASNLSKSDSPVDQSGTYIHVTPVLH